MSPRYLRYTFPADAPDEDVRAEARARAMAALFLAIPPHELTVGRLDTAAAMLTDRGSLDYATGDPLGEELAPWLHLVVGVGERRAFVDVDLEVMAAAQVAAKQRRRGVS